VSGNIHGKTVDQFQGVARRNLILLHDLLQAEEGRRRDRPAIDCLQGCRPQPGEPCLCFVRRDVLMAEAEFLTVDQVVAVATPGIEQVNVVAGVAVEEPCCRREALRTLADNFPAAGSDVAQFMRSPGRTAAVRPLPWRN